MSDDAVYLEDLRIFRMPGVPPTRAFRIDELAPGINVVHGPNESGKTVVARAINIAVHEAPAPGVAVELGARLRAGDERFELMVDGDHRSFQKSGDQDEGLRLSSAPADRYRLWLHELLQARDPNRDLAKRILQESASGYRIRDAQDALGFRDSPSTTAIGEHREHRAAKEHLKKTTREVENPREAERRLAELEAERERVLAARERAAALEAALEHRRHETEIETAEHRLRELPDALDRLRGDELERLKKLREELADAREVVRGAERRLAEAEERLKEVDLPDGAPPEEFTPTVRGRVQQLQRVEERIAVLEREVPGARAKMEEARRALGDLVDSERLERVSAELVQEAERHAERAEELQQKQATLEAVDAWLARDEAPGDTDAVAEGVRALRRWLQEPRGGEEPVARTAGLIASVLTALAGLGAVGLAWRGTVSTLMLVTGVALALAGGLLVYLVVRTRSAGSREDDRDAHRREFERTSLDPPSSWERDAVEERLETLHEKLVERKLAVERERERARLAPDRERLREDENELEEEARDLAERVGFRLELGERSFLWVVRSLAEWQTAHADLAASRAELEEARQQAATLTAEIASKLAPHGYDEAGADADELASQVEGLERRIQAFRSAENDQERAQADLEKGGGAVERARSEIETLFETLGLEGEDDAELRRLCERQEEYDTLQSTKAGATVLRDQALRKLREEPGYEKRLEELGETELESELSELQDRLRRLDDLQEEIPQLRERIRNAKKEQRVEEAIEARDRALDALRDRMRAETAQVVGWAVAEHVYERTRDHDRPAVFGRAGQFLATITRGRYELGFSDADPPEFRARDTRHDEWKTLDELSSGTRVQLLLAVRLAFVEEHESGPKLPLLLDETLANTDDIRARAIIEAVIRIAESGRQVFYLTAQDDEVGKWRAALEGDGTSSVPHRFVELTRVRALSEEREAPKVEVDPFPKEAVPAPEGRSHDAYREALSVPPFDPRAEVGALHLWYLIEDVNLLHRFLALGVECWGQLETLLDRVGEIGTLVSGEERAALEACARAVATLCEAWAIGRGRPVDRMALHDAPGVSDTKHDEIAELADRVGGDAGELLEALARGEVSYYREHQREKLEEFLRREGYLDERPRLSADEIRQRVLVKVAREVETGVVERETIVEVLARLTT